jgi:hypothetical protein
MKIKAKMIFKKWKSNDQYTIAVSF